MSAGNPSAARCRACSREHRDLLLARRLAVDQPPDHEVEVPADPRPNVIAGGVELLDRRLLPEAAEDPIGE
jgi:hypothetical protein